LSLEIQESLSILQNLFHDIISNWANEFTCNSTKFADLVLCTSTELKHSYHFIYTNTCIRFESQQTIYEFIILILYRCSHLILSNSCHQQFLQSIDIHSENNSNNCLKYLQTILTHTNFCNRTEYLTLK
jgi:hypothetical protein